MASNQPGQAGTLIYEKSMAMSLRAKVYGALAVAVASGVAVQVYKSKPAWLVSAAQAKTPNSKDGKKEAKKQEKDPTPVEVAVARKQAISDFVTSTANLRALRDVAVSTQADGIVQKVLAEEGDYVKEGQALADLDDAQLQIRLRLALEKLAQAKVQLERSRIRQEKATALIRHNRAELSRFESAAKEGLASEAEVAALQYKRDELNHDEKAAVFDTRELEHRISELEAEIAQNKLDISRARVRAPYAGFITQRMVNVGQRVRALDPLFNLGAFSPLFADVHISERDARSVQPKQEATIRLGSDDNATVKGRVERISPIVDQSSGTVKVTIALEPSNGFRPGAFVRVDIRTDTRADAVLIPKRAIIEEDGQNYVYVASDDRANRIRVTLGYQSEGLVEIRQGVNQGQRVVVAGHGALKEGSKIKVVTAHNAGQATATAKL